MKYHLFFFSSIILMPLLIFAACNPTEKLDLDNLPDSLVTSINKTNYDSIEKVESLRLINKFDKLTVSDIDGNVYHSITIGKQVWMVENLKVTHYRNGDAIPHVTDSAIWNNLNTGAYCNYNNDTGFTRIYGRLYNWYCINDARNPAPKDWHVATINDWLELVKFLGGDSIAGFKIQKYNPYHKMISMETGEDVEYNLSGFTALPGGFRKQLFSDQKRLAYFWTSTKFESDGWSGYAYNFQMTFPTAKITLNEIIGMNAGLSVRCVKNQPTEGNYK